MSYNLCFIFVLNQILPLAENITERMSNSTNKSKVEKFYSLFLTFSIKLKLFFHKKTELLLI